MHGRLVIALLAVCVVAGLLAPVSAAATPALPNSMAALGDSITRAYDVCCSYRDHPGQYWSTGAWYDGISSHYERIKRRNKAITGHAYNHAVTGAKMAVDARATRTEAHRQQVVAREVAFNQILAGVTWAASWWPTT